MTEATRLSLADEKLTPEGFVNDILSACDSSNWDADRNTGAYFRGLKDAYECIQYIAIEYQTSMYEWSKRPKSGPSEPIAQGQRKTIWQPIETAPKDGTEVVLYGACYPEHSQSRYAKDANVGWFSGGEWKTRVYGETCDATHWMPLLPAPVAAGNIRALASAQEGAATDAAIPGTGFMKDGKHIPLSDVHAIPSDDLDLRSFVQFVADGWDNQDINHEDFRTRVGHAALELLASPHTRPMRGGGE